MNNYIVCIVKNLIWEYISFISERFNYFQVFVSCDDYKLNEVKSGRNELKLKKEN